MILPEDKYSSTNFLTLWDFKGIFEYSLLFYGWYTDSNSTTACSDGNNSKTGYLPFAYFLTGLGVYAYSFVAILRKYVYYYVFKLHLKSDFSRLNLREFLCCSYSSTVQFLYFVCYHLPFCLHISFCWYGFYFPYILVKIKTLVVMLNLFLTNHLKIAVKHCCYCELYSVQKVT